MQDVKNYIDPPNLFLGPTHTKKKKNKHKKNKGKKYFKKEKKRM
jgi:hypothetical protein